MVTTLPVTAVIINFKTPDLIRRVVTSFRQYYPTVPLLLIDNGSHDESVTVLEEFQQQTPAFTEVIINDRNLHHGPVMDQALRYLRTPYALFIDSDCEIIKGGFIELMLAPLREEPRAYAIGKRIFMNKRGFDVPESSKAFPYIRPICMLMKRELYLTLPPFEHHGTPCLKNMISAVKRNLQLIDFPIEEYIRHEGRGTASRFGYNLGWRGKLNYLLNKVGL